MFHNAKQEESVRTSVGIDGSIFLEASTKPESDKIRSSLTFTIAKESIRDRVTG